MTEQPVQKKFLRLAYPSIPAHLGLKLTSIMLTVVLLAGYQTLGGNSLNVADHGQTQTSSSMNDRELCPLHVIYSL